jgi:hypothetical protein
MVSPKYHTVEQFLKIQYDIVERGKLDTHNTLIDTHNTLIHDFSFYWLGIGNSIKSGGVNLDNIILFYF